MRVSKADGSQTVDLQRDAFLAAGVDAAQLYEDLASERTVAGLASARARGRKGGRPYKMTPAELRLAAASMGKADTKVGELCKEIGVTRQTLSRHVSPMGSSDPAGCSSSPGGRRASRGRTRSPPDPRAVDLACAGADPDLRPDRSDGAIWTACCS